MKTFGEVHAGDVMYSFNYKKWGKLTEHKVVYVERNEHKSRILIKDYQKYHGVIDKGNGETDLEIIARNKATVGEVAPSIEGLKQYWLEYKNDRLKKLQGELDVIKSSIEIVQRNIEKIESMKSSTPTPTECLTD